MLDSRWLLCLSRMYDCWYVLMYCLVSTKLCAYPPFPLSVAGTSTDSGKAKAWSTHTVVSWDFTYYASAIVKPLFWLTCFEINAIKCFGNGLMFNEMTWLLLKCVCYLNLKSLNLFVNLGRYICRFVILLSFSWIEKNKPTLMISNQTRDELGTKLGRFDRSILGTR